MIIRSLELKNWRGLVHFKSTFDAGLNFLFGTNEAGKSTVAEALYWALFRDVTDANNAHEIAAIIPVFAAEKIPSVKVLLAFSFGEVSVTKYFSPHAANSKCLLQLRPKNQSDTRHEGRKAEEMLARLINHQDDDINTSPQWALNKSIVFGGQGKSTFRRQLNAAQIVRSAFFDAITVSAKGDVVLSPRLEFVRQRLQEKLQHSSTINTLREQLNNIDAALKDQQYILALEKKLQELEAKNQRLQREQTQNVLAMAKFTEYEAAQIKRDNLRKLMADLSVARERITVNQKLLDVAQEHLETLRSAMENAEKCRVECQRAHHEKLREMEAWESWLEVKEKQTAKNHAQRLHDHLRELAEKWERAQEKLPDVNQVIQPSRLSNWRERFRDIAAEEQRLAYQMRCDIKWQNPITLEWRADEGEWHQEEISAGAPFNIRGKSTFDVRIAGQGRMKIALRDDKSNQNTAQNIVAKRQLLYREMAKYDYEKVDLPADFDTLETQIAQQQELFKIAQNARAEWMDAVRGCSFLENMSDAKDTNSVLIEAGKQAEESVIIWKSAKKHAAQYKSFYQPGMTSVQVSEKRHSAIRQRRHAEQSAVTAEKDCRRKTQLFYAEKEHVAKLENAMHADQKIAKNAESTLQKIGDNASTKELLQKYIIQCEALKKELQLAEGHSLNNVARASVIQETQQKLQDIQQQMKTLQDKLASCRARAKDYPKDLRAQQEKLTQELRVAQMRQRGLQMLNAVIEMQRARFNNSIAAPLNARLSPWLSILRGKATKVEFDASRKRLITMRTWDEQGHYQLNFNAQSDGLREQTALLVRLIYMQLASEQLSGEKLPLILDDPLTHTDAWRHEGLIKVLSEAAGTLQIIYATCHENVQRVDDAQYIKLDS